MLRIHLLTGLAFTKTIDVDGDYPDDILQILDDLNENFGQLPVTNFDPEELTDEQIENYIPINGGEYYIEGISHIEYITD